MALNVICCCDNAAFNQAYARHDLKVTKEHLRELLARSQKLHEHERTRLADAVHDDVSQQMTALCIELSLLQKQLGGSIPHSAKLGEILKLAGQINQSVRKITNDLHPKVLDTFGLLAAMKYECQQVEKSSGIKVSFQSHDEDLNLPETIAAELFRIFQEIVTNTLRHAEATEIAVKTKLSKGMLRICVHDNGKGIARKKIGSNRSLGLLNIHERVLRLGGKARFQRIPTKGTMVVLQIPI